MKQFIFLVCLMSFSVCQSEEFEFGVVNDQDGYVNVRSSNKIEKDNVVDKLNNGSVLSHFGRKGNWIQAHYEKNGKSFHGYVYENRIKSITDFTRIPETERSENTIVLSNKSIEISLFQSQFDKTKHILTPIENNSTFIKEINGKPIWGTDGGIPKRQYKAIKVRMGASIIEFPKEATENLYEPSLFRTRAFYDSKTQTLYIQSFNSDGAGGYAVTWVVEKGVYKNRIVDWPF